MLLLIMIRYFFILLKEIYFLLLMHVHDFGSYGGLIVIPTLGYTLILYGSCYLYLLKFGTWGLNREWALAIMKQVANLPIECEVGVLNDVQFTNPIAPLMSIPPTQQVVKVWLQVV